MLKSCSYLASFTKERAVWALLLRFQCIDNFIPFSTYNFADMTQQQLEHAAATPYLFREQLLSPDPFCLQERVVTFTSPLVDGSPDDKTFSLLTIINGGRFLVSRVDCTVMVCDLGLPSSASAVRPKVVAHLSLAGGDEGKEVYRWSIIPLSNSTWIICATVGSEINRCAPRVVIKQRSISEHSIVHSLFTLYVATLMSSTKLSLCTNMPRLPY